MKTKECRRDEIWELLDAEDLVLTAEIKEEAEQKFLDWRQAMAKRGMKVSVAKTKVMITGEKQRWLSQADIHVLSVATV